MNWTTIRRLAVTAIRGLRRWAGAPQDAILITHTDRLQFERIVCGMLDDGWRFSGPPHCYRGFGGTPDYWAALLVK